MKALTIQQPWAWAVAAGHKPVENRSTPWRYRGPLAIHAGAQWSERGAKFRPLREAFAGRLPECPPILREDFPAGAVIGVAELVDVHLEEGGCCKPWGEQSYVESGGRVRREVYHLALVDARTVAPVACPGRLGLWELPLDLDELTR